MTEWSAEQAEQLYAVRHWGDGYFSINEQGQVCVSPDLERPEASASLQSIMDKVADKGLHAPVLIRFPQILTDRVRRLREAFQIASERLDYKGRYLPVYPIKVNQQRSVVEGILAGQGTDVGLEAGSKPELIAIMAMAPQGGTLVCNGYKDRAYIRLALIAQKLGHRVFIVVEKFSELNLILSESRDMQIEPQIGLRLRLSSMANGHWQNSGGEEAKFGLPSRDLLRAIDVLKEANLLHRLELVHFHMGSQISNVRDIQTGMREAVRYMSELVRLGAPISVVDVGGGLGVDYEGSGSREYFSMNYRIEEFAKVVVQILLEECGKNRITHPDIITEAGRAMTAHHAVMVTNVIDVEVPEEQAEIGEIFDSAPNVIQDLWNVYENVEGHVNPTELFHEALYWLNEAQDLYVHGLLDLQQKAQVESLFYAICSSIAPRLDPLVLGDREVLDHVNRKMAVKLFINLSIFQSLPDVWGIQQVFPILPVEGLSQAPDRKVRLSDLTCDSDGKIDRYVARGGQNDVLPLPSLAIKKGQFLAIFLVGAYQETLGDIHNLFGDTESVIAAMNGSGEMSVAVTGGGESVSQVIRHVQYEPEHMIQRILQKEKAGSGRNADSEYKQELLSCLAQSTYMTEINAEG